MNLLINIVIFFVEEPTSDYYKESGSCSKMWSQEFSLPLVLISLILDVYTLLAYKTCKMEVATEINEQVCIYQKRKIII